VLSIAYTSGKCVGIFGKESRVSRACILSAWLSNTSRVDCVRSDCRNFGLRRRQHNRSAIHPSTKEVIDTMMKKIVSMYPPIGDMIKIDSKVSTSKLASGNLKRVGEQKYAVKILRNDVEKIIRYIFLYIWKRCGDAV
jgi:hypothetical protein